MTDVAKPSSHDVDFQPEANLREPWFDLSEVELAPAPITWRWGRPADMAAMRLCHFQPEVAAGELLYLPEQPYDQRVIAVAEQDGQIVGGLFVVAEVAAEMNFNSLQTKPSFTKQRKIFTYFDAEHTRRNGLKSRSVTRLWKAGGDEKTMYIRVSGNRFYRLDLANRCSELSWPDPVMVNRFRGDTVCSPLDFDMKISRNGPDGAPVPCIVKTMTRLSPAEVAALPKKQKP